MTQRYVVASPKIWSRENFERCRSDLPGEWIFISRKDELTADRLREIDPRYVFFPHWSWRVPPAITGAFECVCFHMTDVPYGRGGSPLQNLILRGHRNTVVSALRMVEEMDAGPVYLKRPMSLEGSAEEIYRRADNIVFDMITHIVQTNPATTAQVGEPVLFERRRPEESILPATGAPEGLYDFIRMLDAEGYPHAFLDHGSFRMTFTDARFDGERLTANVAIQQRGAKQ